MGRAGQLWALPAGLPLLPETIVSKGWRAGRKSVPAV
jgi:hypothetical protein